MDELLQKIIELLILTNQFLAERKAPTPAPVEVDVWLDSHEVMKKLKIGAMTLYRARENGEVVAKKIGRKWFYLQSSVN
ncbi:hypothetical protein ACVWYN_000043 [Pedobacter sp. UYP24]